MIPSQFYRFRSMYDNEDRITIRSSVKKALPILWCRGGSYVLVPKEVVQNGIDSVEIYTKMSKKGSFTPVVCIYWNQGVPIDNRVGRILSGE